MQTCLSDYSTGSGTQHRWRGSYLTLPPPPTRFLCAPPPLWPTCRGAAPWLPWWPGPVPVGSGESVVSRERGSFSGRQCTSTPITCVPASSKKQHFHCFIWGSKKIWNGLLIHFRESLSFPQISLSPIHFQITIHGGETLWPWIPPSLTLIHDTLRHGENRSSLTSEFSSITWHWRWDCKDHVKACCMDLRNDLKPPACCLPSTL